MPPTEFFPPTLSCRLGTLVYGEVALFDDKVGRYYELDLTPPATTSAAAYAQRLCLTVHPPDIGLTNIPRAVRYIERTWDAIHAQLPRILRDTVPILTPIILDWYGDEPCPVDRIPDMLNTGHIHVIAINLDGEHWLYLDGNDVIHRRDVVIYLSGTLQVIRSHMDG